jgi:isocitrate dehydrogenase kinase/phosphatase
VKLNDELTDTLQQLEEKSAILFKTQEEKEVQEHLVFKHAKTEEKISQQAHELREVADQQYTDLEKLQEVRERKRFVMKDLVPAKQICNVYFLHTSQVVLNKSNNCSRC